MDISDFCNDVFLWVMAFRQQGFNEYELDAYSFEQLGSGLGPPRTYEYEGYIAFVSASRASQRRRLAVHRRRGLSPTIFLYGASPPLDCPFLITSDMNVLRVFLGEAVLIPSEANLLTDLNVGDDFPLLGAQWFGNARLLGCAPEIRVSLQAFSSDTNAVPIQEERVVCPWWSDGTTDMESAFYRISELRCLGDRE